MSETIPLRYLTAAGVSTMIKTVPGIDQLTFNRQDNSVTAHGSPKAIETLKAELHAADVPPVAYKIAMRLVRYAVDAQGQCVETVVMEPMILDMNKSPAMCAIGNMGNNFLLAVTPRQAGGKTVQLTMEVQQRDDQGQTLLSGKNVRRVKLGESVRIVGMTNAADNAIHRAALRGEIVAHHGEYTGYYVKTTLDTPPVPAPK